MQHLIDEKVYHTIEWRCHVHEAGSTFKIVTVVFKNRK